MELTDISCKTVSDIPENLREKLLNGFSNERNSVLVEKLRNYEKETAKYYIVYCGSTPLFNFSLQASCLFIKQYTPSTESIEAAKMFKTILVSSEVGDVEKTSLTFLKSYIKITRKC